MRRWLIDAPWWALALVTGVPFGLAMAVFDAIQGRSWTSAAVGGAIQGAFYGAVMARLLRRQYERRRQAVGALRPEVERSARRASWRGRVPDGPEVRAATLLIIDHELTELQRRRTFTLVALGLFTALNVLEAITRSPWWWLAAAFFVAMLLWSVVLLPGRLRRRAALLRSSPPDSRQVDATS